MHIDHEHTHGSEDAHENENNHSHTHTHEHSHEHTHDHTHSHSHGVDSGASKELVLLKYMLDHNRQHARELEEAAAKFKKAGESGAAELIADAVHYFEHGNEKLEQAVSLLSGEA